MDCPVDCSNGLSADYSDGLSGRLHCPAGQSLEWSLDSLRKIVPVSTMKFYNFPENVGDCKDLALSSPIPMFSVISDIFQRIPMFPLFPMFSAFLRLPFIPSFRLPFLLPI